MSYQRLDPKLLMKIAAKLDRPKEAVNVMVSKRARKHGISSESALVIIARELGIGTATFQRKLDATKQEEIRTVISNSVRVVPQVSPVATHTRKKRHSQGYTTSALRAAVESVIQDAQLRQRCVDILLGKSAYDRAINQATLVLENRIRLKASPPKRLVGEALVGFAFNADLNRTVLKISNNLDEQRGYTDILRGIVPTFRNRTHHHIIDNISREDAIRVCGFIDVLVRLVDQSVKIR